MDNKIIMFDKNQNEEIVSKIKGLDIVFRGENSEVLIEEGSTFISSKIVIHNNCKVYIKKTNRYGIRSLSSELADNCNLIIGKDFSAVSLRISLNQEKNLNVTIGDYCMCASDVKIRPSDGHTIYKIENKEIVNRGEDVFIGDHVWIGLDCIILKGTRVSNNTIIGARSLVNKKFAEENVIIAGSPCKVVKHGVNWDRRSPGFYDNPAEFRKIESDYKLVYEKKKFEK